MDTFMKNMFKYIKGIALLMAGTCLLGAAPQSVYNQHRDKVIVQEKIVQFGQNIKVIGVPVTDLHPEYYYRRSPEKGQYINEDSLAKKIAEELAKKLVELGIRPPGTNEGPAVDQTIAKVTDLIDKRCASCHSGDKPEAGLSFVDKNGKIELTDKSEKLTKPEIAWLMFSNVLDETMPKGSSKLTLEETKMIHELAKYITKQQKEN